MNKFLAYVFGALFFVISYFLNANANSSPLYFSIISLYKLFFISHVIYIGLYFIVAHYIAAAICEGSHVDGGTPISEEKCAEFANKSIFVFIAILVILTPMGFYLSENFKVGCYDIDRPCRAVRDLSDNGILFYGIGRLVGFLFIPAFFIGFTMLGAATGTFAQRLVSGAIALSNRHPAESVIQKSLKQFRSDPTVERDLLRIMDEQDATDEDIEKLVGRLAPWERWYKRIEYRKRARDARRLREMAELQRQAIAEETGLADAIHETERARRASDSRWRR